MLHVLKINFTRLTYLTHSLISSTLFNPFYLREKYLISKWVEIDLEVDFEVVELKHGNNYMYDK